MERDMTQAAPRRPRIDGRRLRRVRTRQLFIEAYLELLRESPRVPTATQVAERAGYSVRSIFDHFGDLRTLILAAVAYADALASAEPMAPHVEGDRLSRVRSHVAARARTCERWFPLWRVVISDQVELTDLEDLIDQERLSRVEELKLTYRPELSTLPYTECRQILIALETLTDFENWARMRERHRLSVEAARGVWIVAIDRILPLTPLAS